MLSGLAFSEEYQKYCVMKDETEGERGDVIGRPFLLLLGDGDGTRDLICRITGSTIAKALR